MQEAKLLGIVLPSFPVLYTVLERIREKYNMPPVLPENVQLAETLRAERTQEEWAAVLSDLEAELQAEVFTFPPGLAGLINPVLEMARQHEDRSDSDGENGSADDSGSAKTVAALMAVVGPVIEWRDRACKGLAQRLLDYLVTGRPIEFPEQLVYPMARLDFPPGDDQESVVIALAHRFSNPDEMSQRFRAKIIETFGSRHTIQEEHLGLAEYLARKNTGKNIQENVDLYLERHPDAIPYRRGTKRYADELRKLKNNMKVDLYRLQKWVEELTGYKKR